MPRDGHIHFTKILVCCLAMFAAQAGAADPAYDLYIANARVVVGDGKVLERASVGIVDDRITWVGPDEGGSGNAEVLINGEGKTVIPGLMDAHVHILSSDHLADEDSLNAYMSLIVPHWLKGMLLHGVTTIRTLGVPIKESRDVKRGIEAGAIQGPRVLTSGPGLTSPQGHPAATMFGQYPALQQRFARVASNEAEARAAIVEVIEAGMDSPLKVIFEGGEPGGEPYSILGTPALRLPRELMKAAVDEAHSRDYRISVHTHTYEDALIAVQMGVDGLEHGVVSEPLPDDRLLEAMLERDVFLVSTLRLLEATNQLDDLPVAAANLKALHEGGVRVVAGSDTPGGWTVPGLNTIYELRLLVKAGLAPSEAIRAATYNAAVALEIEDDLGRVRQGLLADILVLSGNPLEDISVLHYPRYVIKGGEVVRGFE